MGPRASGPGGGGHGVGGAWKMARLRRRGRWSRWQRVGSRQGPVRDTAMARGTIGSGSGADSGTAHARLPATAQARDSGTQVCRGSSRGGGAAEPSRLQTTRRLLLPRQAGTRYQPPSTRHRQRQAARAPAVREGDPACHSYRPAPPPRRPRESAEDRNRLPAGAVRFADAQP
jgi:hypothetical protein